MPKNMVITIFNHSTYEIGLRSVTQSRVSLYNQSVYLKSQTCCEAFSNKHTQCIICIFAIIKRLFCHIMKMMKIKRASLFHKVCQSMCLWSGTVRYQYITDTPCGSCVKAVVSYCNSNYDDDVGAADDDMMDDAF